MSLVFSSQIYNGDTRALEVLKDYTDTIAMGLFNIQAAVDPDCIAIGGGISKQPILMIYIQKSLDELYEKMPVPIPQVKLVQCKYNNDSNLIGAFATIRKYTKRGSNEPLVFILLIQQLISLNLR